MTVDEMVRRAIHIIDRVERGVALDQEVRLLRELVMGISNAAR